MTANEAEVSPATILVVDDNRANLIALEAVLAPLGYSVVTASSGGEAIQCAFAHDFVLILMDVHMPVLDGYQTVEILRRNERSRDVPIVFLTAVYNQIEHTRRGYALGAVDYMSKPFDAEVLRAKVRALVSLYMLGERAERVRSQELDRIKDVFLGAVGHDLRNPLNSVTMSAKLMLASPECAVESHRRNAARIDRAASRMNQMIEDILDLTRGQFAGGIPVKLSPMDLGEVCRAVIAELQIAHPGRVLTLDVADHARGEWDAGRLSRVVSNLVGNAVKHCADGPVRVVVADEGERVSVRVHNLGAPISSTVLPRLFEPFRRGDTSTEGLGLGLFIVREIARAHGGSVDVRSTPEGGTTFTVTLPRKPATPQVS